jgi:hypothetical protein
MMFTSQEKIFILKAAIIFLFLLAIGAILTISARRMNAPTQSDQTATTTSDPQEWPAPGHDLKG